MTNRDWLEHEIDRIRGRAQGYTIFPISNFPLFTKERLLDTRINNAAYQRAYLGQWDPAPSWK